MQNLSNPRARLRTAALLPVAVVAWLTLGTGAAMAAPSVHAAAAATSQPADPGVSNNGNGQDNGKANGQAKGQDKGSQVSGSTSQDASTASGSASSSSDHSSGNAGTSGDPSQPQPVSNADQNSGGANGKCPGGPYCSTRDGSPSGNGNGGGKATGKPCAGCVGKADNKNPKGQYPNGSDNNAGYECDRNHGIGRSNPAHTGCTSGGTTDCTTNPTAEGCSGGGTDCTTNPTAEGCNGGGTDCTTNPTAEGCNGGTDCTTNPTAEGCNGGTDCTTNPDMDGCSSGGPECAALPDLPECVNTGNECTAATATNGTCTAVLGEKQTRTPNTPPSTTNVLGENITRTPTAALPFTGANIALMTGIALMTVLFGGGLVLAARRRKSLTS